MEKPDKYYNKMWERDENVYDKDDIIPYFLDLPMKEEDDGEEEETV